jgi:hypothetical protein
MYPFIRRILTLFFLYFIVLNVFGGTGSVCPVRTFSFRIKLIAKLDSSIETGTSSINVHTKSAVDSKDDLVSSGRICSCQILNLESSNYDHRYVVLLAEKANSGRGEAYAIARNRIQKEKKLLKRMFYDKVKVVAEMQGAGSCKSMFFRLRTADRNLQLYEILNAD